MYTLWANDGEDLNYLAHAWLSGDSTGRIAGNVLGDLVKGKAFLEFPDHFAEGLVLHRRIDHWTDSNPLTWEASALLRPSLGRTSGIAVDILCDHVLSKGFDDFSTQRALPDMISDTYSALAEHDALYTDQMRFLARRMRQTDWLSAYLELEDLDMIFRRLSNRISWENDLHRAVEAYLVHQKTLDELCSTLLSSAHDYVEDLMGKGPLPIE